MTISKKIISAAVVAGLGLSMSAQGATLKTPSETITGIEAFDWQQGNALAVGGTTAILNFATNSCVAGEPDCNFDVFGHARLSAFTGAGVSQSNLTTGELTYVFGFQETVVEFIQSPITGNTASFDFVDSVLKGGGSNFFRVYYDAVANSDDLAGTGFDDGTLILEGVLEEANAASFSNFRVGDPSSTVLLGSAGSTPATPTNAAGWGATETVVGNGLTETLSLTVASITVNAAFFPSQAVLSFLLDNISQITPFTTVDPSLSFPEGGIADTTARVGPVNGLVVGGDSIILQTDTNSPITTAGIPEPASLALLGLGFAGIGFARRRKS